MRPISGPCIVLREASEVEVTAARAAAVAHVGPAVVAWAGGWLAVDYLPGRHVSTLELSRPTVLAELADLLHRWHASDVTSLPEAPLAPIRQGYLASIPSAAMPAGLEADSACADALERQLEQSAQRRVQAHLDVVANLLATPHGLRLIDFEYAASATPARELGQVVWEAELDRPGLGRLVRAYGMDADVAEEATAGWAWITGVTWTLWALACQDSPVLQQYARRSWERLQHYWACTGG
jgi:thiamine kinase